MKSQISVLIVFALFVGVVYVNGAEEKTCAQTLSEIMKRQVSGVKGCTAKLGFKDSKEKKEKIQCVMKCVLQTEGLLNADGKFDDDSIQKMIESEMPPNLEHLREKGMAMFNGCRTAHEPNLDNSDPYCKSYGALVKCLMAMTTLCQGEP